MLTGICVFPFLVRGKGRDISNNALIEIFQEDPE